MAHDFTRPNLPYNNESLPNDSRFEVITRALNAPPTDIILDSEFNAVIDYLNILDADIAGVEAGAIPGVDDPNNANFMLSTDGAGHSPWKLVEDINCRINSIAGNKLIDSSINTLQINNGAVTLNKLATNSVNTLKIIDLSITTPKIAANAVTTPKIEANAVTTPKIEDNAVTTPKIADEAVTTPKILDGNVTINKLAAEVLALLVPIGAVIPFAGTVGFSVTNWLECNGQAVSRDTYATLFANLGTLYGVGDGTNTFNLPDWRGRVPVGIGSDDSTNGLITAATASNIALGSNGVFGTETITLDITQIPPHRHTLPINTGGGGPDYFFQISNGSTTETSTSSTGGGLPHINTQPSIFTRYYIRAL